MLKAVLVLSLVVLGLVRIDKEVILAREDAVRVERERGEPKDRGIGKKQRVTLVAGDVLAELVAEVARNLAGAVHLGAARAQRGAVVGGEDHGAVLAGELLEDGKNGRELEPRLGERAERGLVG